MLKENALAIMLAYADSGVYEPLNLNDGVQINKFQRLFGGVLGNTNQKGSAYCVYSCLYSYVKAYCVMGGLDPSHWENMVNVRDEMVSAHIIPYTGSCTEAYEWAEKLGVWLPRSQWQQASSGDFVVFDYTQPHHDLARHFGMVVSATAEMLSTVEGNTTKENADSNDPAYGRGGVYRKHHESYGKVMGFIKTKNK